MTADPSRSETTARAVAFVAERRDEAERLGHALADLVHDPDGFARELEAGFASLADPEYLEGERRIAPGLGPVLGVRWPLNAAVARGFRADAQRGRVRRAQIGMIPLDRLKLAEEAVVFRVGERRPIEDVVVVRGLMQERARLGCAPLGGGRGHRRPG